MWPWISFEGFHIPSFLLIQCLNAVLLLVWARARAQQLELPPRQGLDLTFLVLFTGLIGGRLLHVFWESPNLYWSQPMTIFSLTSGGYTYFGGLLLALPISWLYLQRLHEPKGPWFDFAAPLASAGTAIGRIGCLLAGCCYGRVCDLPWALPFWDDQGLRLLRHPTQLYSVIWELGILALLLGLEKTPLAERPRWIRQPGALFGVWIAFHSLGRFFIEFLRDDFRGPQYFLSLSQWLSLCALILSCLILRQTSRHQSEIRQKPAK